jgi:hypothetical protein
LLELLKLCELHLI